MSRTSSMWRSSRRVRKPFLRICAGVLCAALVALGCGGPSEPLCLPPLFEGGQRLHDRHGANLFDLDLIFGQHEICDHTEQKTQLRKIALIGNSATFGLNVSAEDTFAGQLNQRWESNNSPFHIYNLGFVTTYVFKDALIARKAIEFEPDVIVFALSLADFVHTAPIPWPDALPMFFGANNASLDRVRDEGAAGLEEVVETYALENSNRSWVGRRWIAWRERGGYLRLATRYGAPHVINRFLLSDGDGEVMPKAPDEGFPQAGPNYRCNKVIDAFETKFGENWSNWNVLAYLEQLKREHGVKIAVLDSPIEHNPRDACYNARQPSDAGSNYRAWLRKQTSARGLALWDLHDLLPRDQFSDTIHPTAEGHRTIASTLAEPIEALLKTPYASRPTTARDKPGGQASIGPSG